MKQYVVDAFTDTVFSGNPAAVCITDNWLDDTVLQNIAAENNLSETAFAVKSHDSDTYRLRWFTPGGEIELCGHATLATAFVILNFTEPERKEVHFDTLSGQLTVVKNGDMLSMDFPSFTLRELPVTPEITAALGGATPEKVYFGADTVCVFNDEKQLRSVIPDLEIINHMDGVCFHITAPGYDYDCVTRSFAPKCNVAEDPVCGRGHCHVVPLWAKTLGKNRLNAFQASKRGGVLYCTYKGDRTILSGKAALYSVGEIFVP